MLGLRDTDPQLLAGELMQFQPVVQQLLSNIQSLARAQDEDPDLVSVKQWVEDNTNPEEKKLDFGTPALRAYRKMLPSLVIGESDPAEGWKLLFRKPLIDTDNRTRTFIPRQLVVPLIMDCHLSLSHLGSEKVALFLQTCVWFPNMWARIREVLSSCLGCIQKNNHQLDKRISGCYFPRATKMPQVKGKTHEVVAHAFIDNWVYSMGTPTLLVSDN